RLLAFDRDPITREPSVEVAHEALLRAWDRLRVWLDAGRADIRAQRQLAVATTEWIAAARDPSYLLAGAPLGQVGSWAAQTELALTHDEQAFLEASSAERARQEVAEHARQQHELLLQRRAANRLRYLVGGLALFLVVALGLSVFAFNRQAAAVTNLS